MSATVYDKAGANAAMNAAMGKQAKRVVAPIVAPVSAISGAVARDWLQRTLITLPVTTTRWRIRFANRNVGTNVALTTPVTSTPWYIGDPTYSSGRWAAATAAAPVAALNGFTAPTDGTDYVSEWVTDSAKQFVKGKGIVLSWGVTAPTGGSGVGQGWRQAWAVTSGSGSALAGSQNPAGAFVSGTVLLGDIRLEYEFSGVQEIGLFIGDSISAGQGDGNIANDYPSTLYHETLVGAAEQRGGFAAINAGIPGSGAGLWGASTNWCWTRLDLATTVPDFAVIELGTNDVGSGATLSNIQATTLGYIQRLRGLGVSRIFLCTIPPHYPRTRGYLTANAAAGATTIQSSADPAAATSLLIGSGRNQEIVTPSAVAGGGPYTITVSALTKAHQGASGYGEGAEQVVHGASEIMRQQFNDWVRALPNAISGVIDIDAIIALSPGAVIPDPRLMSADGLHPLRSGYQRIGEVAALAGQAVKPAP